MAKKKMSSMSLHEQMPMRMMQKREKVKKASMDMKKSCSGKKGGYGR